MCRHCGNVFVLIPSTSIFRMVVNHHSLEVFSGRETSIGQASDRGDIAAQHSFNTTASVSAKGGTEIARLDVEGIELCILPGEHVELAKDIVSLIDLILPCIVCCVAKARSNKDKIDLVGVKRRSKAVLEWVAVG